jgi:hypothetical protein
MPFNKTAPKTLFSFNSTKSSPEDIEDLEEKKKQRGEIMSKASYKARDNLTWELLQSFLGSKRSKTPEALEQQLECMWQEEVQTSPHDIKKQKHGPQLHSRFFLDNENGDVNLIEGEFEESEIPTKWNSNTKKQEHIRLTPKMVIGFEKGQPFRDHIRDNWLPEGLIMKIFWAKDKKGNRLNWTYDCIITRATDSDSCDWDEDA